MRCARGLRRVGPCLAPRGAPSSPSEPSSLRVGLSKSAHPPPCPTSTPLPNPLPPAQAFATLIAALNTTAAGLLANKTLLTDVLSLHVEPQAYTSDKLADGQVCLCVCVEGV
jgi:hypothetical protein